MKAHHGLFIGGGVIVAAYAYYAHKKGVLPVGSMPTASGKKQIDRSAASGFFKGYTSMMKTPPEYYNNTSTEGAAMFTEGSGSVTTDSGYEIPTAPWAMGTNGGNASQISAGWTSVADTYSAKVSSFWQQQAVAGSHN